MEITLDVQAKNVYGTDRIYPMNDTAKKIADLLGRKTFNKDDLKKLQEIGFKFNWVPIVF